MVSGSHEIVFYVDQDNSNPVLDYIMNINQTDRAKIDNTIEILGQLGYRRELSNIRHIANKLFELRTGYHRILYSEDKENKRFVLLHAFRKATNVTPRMDIELAMRYLGEYKRTGKYQIFKSPTKFDDKSSVNFSKQQNKSGKSKTSPKVSKKHEKKAQTNFEDVETRSATEANILVNNRAQAVFNDRAHGEDQLGIRDEVEALAETLLLRDVEPPVAIGVLGGWGSGKSFVIHLINQYVQSVRAKSVKKGWGNEDEKDPQVPAFVGHIYQINFNAWTYAKSNLWASLMDTIFSSLNRQMQLERLLAHKELSPNGPPPSKDQIVANMLAGGDEFKKIYLDNVQIDQDKDLEPWRKNLVHWSQYLMKETLLWNIMRGQQVETFEKLKDTEEQLHQLKQRREQFEKERVLNEIEASDLDDTARLAYLQSIKNFMLAFLSDALSGAAKEELKKQDVKDEDIQKFLKEAKGVWGGLNTIIAAFRRSKLYLLWAIIFFALTLFLPSFWTEYAEKPIQFYIAQGISIFLTILPVAKVLYSWAVKFVSISQEANKILEGAYATQQAKHAEIIVNSTDMPLSQKISQLQNDISQGSLAAYDALINLLETQAEEQRQKIGPSAKYSNLFEFVQSRIDAAVYENQLGLMHQVRQDVDELTFNLVDNADKDIFPRGKPRVILYIDDLDRCPPGRVVEMLEAVQLLLNTKLFIVILGLDTRYVTRALEKEYKEILQHEGDPSGLDYIEKIIQIPYRVRSIENDVLRNYLEKQMDIEKSLEPKEERPNLQLEDIKTLKPSKPEPEVQDLKPSEDELPSAVIQFKQDDLEDLAVCCQKITLTPRSIKRLVNVFKLMKIFWFRADDGANISERDRPRVVKQAAISLLALSSAYPEIMREVFVHFETLYRQGKEKTELFTALNNIKLPPGSGHELSWQLKKYKDDISGLKAIASFEKEKFGQLTLQELGLSTFNIVRSFSFVGDPMYWEDDEGEISRQDLPEPKKKISSTQVTRKKTVKN